MFNREFIYIGATDEQVQWGNNADPRGVLIEGHTYCLYQEEIHNWYTKLYFVGVDGGFNSVCFEEVK